MRCTAKDAKRAKRKRGEAEGVTQLSRRVLSNSLPASLCLASFDPFDSFAVTNAFYSEGSETSEENKMQRKGMNQLSPPPPAFSPLCSLRFLRCKNAFLRTLCVHLGENLRSHPLTPNPLSSSQDDPPACPCPCPCPCSGPPAPHPAATSHLSPPCPRAARTNPAW